MLKIVSRVKHNESLTMKFNKEGIKFNATYMFVKMTNLDNLIKIHKEKAIPIINKIQYVIHSIASIHLGEINNQRDLIIWKENIDEIYYAKIRYLLNMSILQIIF